jgi:hypothetical protein
MAQFLFIDESGQDHHESPYEVLAGVAIEDGNLWNLINEVQDAELRCFGRRYAQHGVREIKAKKLLKRKVFRQANLAPEFSIEERTQLSKQCLDAGQAANVQMQAALAQAKLAFVGEVFDICTRFRCKFFASIVDPRSPAPFAGDHLRKDYAYLFERFFYYLEDLHNHFGLVVFDELEKSQSHVLIGQMDSYFKKTTVGRQRSSLVIPEPFFVHSDLTTGIQIVDLAAYVISWNVRFSDMDGPRRSELDRFGQQVLSLRYRAVREKEENPSFNIWSYSYISDLRSKTERNFGL